MTCAIGCKRKLRRCYKHVAPAWAMTLVLVVWAVYFVLVILPDGLSPGLPIFLVLGYLMLCRLFNRSYAVVSAGRVETGVGPLPGGGRPDVGTAVEVVRWYVRVVTVQGRFGTTKFYAAGVELADGRWIDVLAPYETKEEAWRAASEACRVFGGGSPLPVAEIGGLPRKRNWRGTLIVIAWGVAVIVALLLGMWMEVYRVGQAF